MTEKGRHLWLDRNWQYCLFCPHLVEDEIHFVLVCEKINRFQKNIYTPSKFPCYPNERHFCTPMSTRNVYLLRQLSIFSIVLKEDVHCLYHSQIHESRLDVYKWIYIIIWFHISYCHVSVILLQKELLYFLFTHHVYVYEPMAYITVYKLFNLNAFYSSQVTSTLKSTNMWSTFDR